VRVRFDQPVTSRLKVLGDALPGAGEAHTAGYRHGGSDRIGLYTASANLGRQPRLGRVKYPRSEHGRDSTSMIGANPFLMFTPMAFLPVSYMGDTKSRRLTFSGTTHRSGIPTSTRP
jgi:hypothetical protein